MASVLIVDTSQSKKAIFAAFWLLIAIRTTTGTLLKFPKDQSVTVGQSVTFECQTDLNLPVFWYFNNHEIFYGGKVSMSFHNMFKVSTDGTGVYDLVISSADKTYNGEYICGDDEGQGEKRSARLNVTVSPTVAPTEQSVSTNSDTNLGIIIGVVVAVVAGLTIGLVISFAVKKYRHRRGRGRTDTKPSKEDVEKKNTDKEPNVLPKNGVIVKEAKPLLKNEKKFAHPVLMGHQTDANKKAQPEASNEPVKIGLQDESQYNTEYVKAAVKEIERKAYEAEMKCGQTKNAPAGLKPVVSPDARAGNRAPNTELSVACEPTNEGPTSISTAAGTYAGGTENIAPDIASSSVFKGTNDITSPTASKMSVSHETGSNAAVVAAGDKEETALAPLTEPNSTDGDATVGSSAAGDPADGTVQSASATTLPNVSMATNEGLAAGCTGIDFSADVREQSARDETVSEPTGEGATARFNEIGSPARGTVQNASKLTSPTTSTVTGEDEFMSSSEKVVEPAKKKPPIPPEKPNKKDDWKGRMIK